jgi:hypothetical protein
MCNKYKFNLKIAFLICIHFVSLVHNYTVELFGLSKLRKGIGKKFQKRIANKEKSNKRVQGPRINSDKHLLQSPFAGLLILDDDILLWSLYS